MSCSATFDSTNISVCSGAAATALAATSGSGAATLSGSFMRCMAIFKSASISPGDW